MNIVNQIRKTVGASTINIYKMDVSTNIIKEIQKGEMKDSKIMAFINSQVSKGKIEEAGLIDLANRLVKKATRTKHIFNSLEKVLEFSANNNCGKWWVEYEAVTGTDLYNVYKY